MANSSWLYISFAAFFTSIFYYFDFRKKCEIRYFSHLPAWGLGTVLGLYLLIYFTLGLIFAISHEMGFSVLKGQVSPWTQLSQFITPGRNPPQWAQQILLGIIIAWTIRLILSTKMVPLFSGTIDNGIDKFFFSRIEEKQRHNQLLGKNVFVEKQIFNYKINHKGQDPTVAEFGKNLIAYFDQMGTLSDPKNVGLVQDVGDCKANEEIAKAMRICLLVLSRTQVKYILLHDLSGSTTKTKASPDHKTLLFRRRLIYSGSLTAVVSIFCLGLYLFPKSEIDKHYFKEIDKQYHVEFSRDPSKNKNIQDFYFNSNRSLVDTLQKISNSLLTKSAKDGVMFISAPAGEGKSTFIKHLEENIFKKSIGRKKIVTINFQDLIYDKKIDFSTRESASITKYETDSVNGALSSLELGTIRSVKEDFDCKKLLSLVDPSFSEGFIIIDELDLLDDNSVKKVILDFQAFSRQSKKIQYLIFLGSPEIFNHFFTDYHHSFQNTKDIFPYSLEGVKFKTLDDIKIRVSTYNKDQSARWDSMKINLLSNKIYSLIQKEKYLSYSIQNLLMSNEVIKNVSNSLTSEINYKEAIYLDLLDRANKLYDRPSKDDKNYNLYKKALMAIAIKHDTPTEKGSFEVRRKEEISFLYRGRVHKFLTRSILNRSGLITVEPFSTAEGEYRFFPFFLHEYLIDEYNKESDHFVLLD